MFASYGAFGYPSKIRSCVFVNLPKLIPTKTHKEADNNRVLRPLTPKEQALRRST